MTHELKILPKYFDDVFWQRKQFEVRRHDRDFKVGDILILKEWISGTQSYSGRSISIPIKYILPGGKFGIEEGYCILGL